MKKPRPPVVTVLGHVDHGKTTLLDYIRKSSVAKKEAGGITQTIGASVIKTDGKEITFIDTPGHAAFSQMRARGARLADLVVLVVAADDGVKPQTIEALKYMMEVNSPFVVAFTKVDLPSADVEKAKGELEKLGVLFEGRGGNTPFVAVSAKAGTGVGDLLETIVLMAQVIGISGDLDANLEAFVIETQRGKSGVLVSVIVKNGKVKVADTVYCGTLAAKVRGLFDFQGKSIKESFPGYPCQILGFSALAGVGSKIGDEPSFAVEQKIAVGEYGGGGLPVVLKASNSGSLEAVSASIPEGVNIVAKSVGNVTQSDVFLAKNSNANIYAFESKANSDVKRLSETEGVKIFEFKIIYELFDALTKIIEEGVEKILGKAQVLASFPYEKRKVAGCKMIEGMINRSSKLKLVRGEDSVGSVKPISLKKGKSDVNEVRQGEEFGIIFEPQLEFKSGDVLLSVQ
ncbi:MAG: translation initiation factor IF-2 [uncultured bacterium]|nr:MAG: translation initiation factor IF-2 [uncultured bacterium]